MSSRSRALFRSTTFRLTARYSLIFISSALILFLLAYSLLSDAVREADRASMAQKLREYGAIELKKGLPGLVDFLRLERENADADEDYLRLVAPDGSRLVDLIPADQDPLPAPLGVSPAPQVTQWLLLPEGREGTLVEVAYRGLSGGGFMVMGKDASDRERLLRQFRMIFAGIMAPVALGRRWRPGWSCPGQDPVLKPIQGPGRPPCAPSALGSMDARVPDPSTPTTSSTSWPGCSTPCSTRSRPS